LMTNRLGLFLYLNTSYKSNIKGDLTGECVIKSVP
jgi:hypothetical protein